MELTIAKAIEPIVALQNPYLKRNPGTIVADNPNMIEFKTKKNKPKVRIMNGNVKKVKTGSKSAFKIPKIVAVINAFPKLSISTPIGSLEIIRKLIAVTNQVRINPAISKTPYHYHFDIFNISDKCEEEVTALHNVILKYE